MRERKNERVRFPGNLLNHTSLPILLSGMKRRNNPLISSYILLYDEIDTLIMRYFLFRWHIRLGWIATIPLVIWVFTGLLMVARPIEEVRGDHLRANIAPPPIHQEKLTLPKMGAAINGSALTLSSDGDGNKKFKNIRFINDGGPLRWAVTVTDAETNAKTQKGRIGIARERGANPRPSIMAFHAYSGLPLPPIKEQEAKAIAQYRRADQMDIIQAKHFDADNNPFDLRKNRPAWQIIFRDKSRFYIASDTGELLAVRTQFWRIFDFAWGLHIMDPVEREDTHHPALIFFALISSIFALLALSLFIKYQPWKRKSMRQGKTHTKI